MALKVCDWRMVDIPKTIRGKGSRTVLISGAELPQSHGRPLPSQRCRKRHMWKVKPINIYTRNGRYQVPGTLEMVFRVPTTLIATTVLPRKKHECKVVAI